MRNQLETKELKFRNIELSKESFLWDFFISFFLVIILPIIFSLFLDLDAMFALASLFILLSWKFINTVIYYFFHGNITLYGAYYENHGDYYDSDVSLREATLEHLRNDKDKYSDTPKYYLGDLEKNDIDSLMELLSFNYNFQNSEKVNLFFIVSLFAMNFLYALMILATIHFITSIQPELPYKKEILILSLVVVFGITIIKLVLESSPSSKYLKNIFMKKDYLVKLKEIEILEVLDNKDVKELKIQKIEHLYKMRIRYIEKIKASIFQIMTPIFFLSYLTIIISYTAPK